MLYHTIATCDVIYLRMHKRPCFKKLVFVKITLFFILKNKPIQTEIIPFPESMFKI